MYQFTLNRNLDKSWAIAVVLLAKLVFGFVPILIRLCQQEIDTNAVMFDRFCVAVLFLLIWDGLTMIRHRWLKSSSVEPEAIEPQPPAI